MFCARLIEICMVDLEERFLEAGIDLDFLPPGNIYRRSLILIIVRAAHKNYAELSQPEMSITQIKFKIQCSFKTSFQNYSIDNT